MSASLHCLPVHGQTTTTAEQLVDVRVVTDKADLFALDRKTGEPRWHYPMDRPEAAGHWGIGASTAVDDTMVFVAGLDGQVRAYRHEP